MKTVSLRIWIPIIVILLTTVLLTGMVFYQTTIQTQGLKQQKLSSVRHLMIRLQRLSEEALKHQHSPMLEQEISSLGIEHEINALVLINPEGKVQYANRYAWKTQSAVKVVPNINAEYISSVANKSSSPIIEFSENSKIIYAYFPVLFAPETSQLRSFSYGVLYISYDLTQALTTIWYEVLTESGMLWLGCVFLMLNFMILLTYLVNKPINYLVNVMQNYSCDKLIEAKLTGKGELTLLSNAFNELAKNLFTTQQHLNRQMDLYAILSATDQLIVRTDSKQVLFDEICKITTSNNRFILAWVGLLNQETQTVEVVAKAGSSVQYLENIFISLESDVAEGQGATATAIREKKYVIKNDFLNCIHNTPWHEKALKHNIRASASFPIIKFGLVVGAFNVYADTQDYFDNEAIELFNEMTKDISFALEKILLTELKKEAETTLVENEKNLSITLDSIGDGVIVLDNTNRVIRMNPVAETLTGWKASQAKGQLFNEVFHIINTQSREQIKDIVHGVLQEKKVCGLSNHTTLISKQGREYHIADSIAPILDEQQNILGVVLVFQDVTEQYAMIEALKTSEQRFQDVIEASNAYIWETDTEGHYTYLTDKVESIKGYKLSQLMGHKLYDFIHEDDIKKTKKNIHQAIQDKERFELTHRNITAEGRVLWEEIKGRVVLDEHGKVLGLRGAGVCINLRKHNEAEIKRLAYYDPLTTLPNRRMINNRLADEISLAKRHGHFGALLFLDLDYFKNLNDSLGHEIGDELLVQIAQRLKSALRREDVAARLGGDEFIVLLSNLSSDLDTAIGKARKVTEKLLDKLREPYLLKEYLYHNNSSIGISLFPLEDEDAATIFKQADIALYRAKDEGRNSFRFYRPEMQEKAYNRLEMEKDLRTALSEQQLQLYYQPQINHHTGLIGAETLLRWKHPIKGFVSPAEFVPVAEEAGLIIEIGNWIFEQGFYQTKIWQDAGILKTEQHISINVSPKQFKQNNFVDDLSSLVKKTGVNARSIILELTEGVFLSDINDTIEKMLHLRALGFIFSVDDFGTGYSSLSYLKQLPISELKIDKAFVDDLGEDNDDQIIVDTIIAMAKHLKFSVIAEGVENEQQLDFLKSHGCFNYQGYFFSKPLDKETFEDYMRQHNLKDKTNKQQH